MSSNRRNAFRARVVDPTQKLPIVMEDDEIQIRGPDGSNRMKTSVRNAVVARAEEEGPPQQRRQFDIPVPVVSEVEDYGKDVKPDFKPPHHYVRHVTVPSVGTKLETVTYLADAEDLEWLRNHSVWGEGGMRKSQLTPDMLERIIDIAEKASQQHLIPNVGELANLVFRFTSMNDTTIIQDVRSYWLQKRERWGKPLMREFWPPTPTNDPNPHRVFRPREVNVRRTRRSRKNDMNSLQRLQQLRDETQQLEELLKLAYERECLKRRAVEHQEEIFYQVMHDLTERKRPRQLQIKLHQRMHTSFRHTARYSQMRLQDMDDEDGGKNGAVAGGGAGARRGQSRKRPHKRADQLGGAGPWIEEERESDGEADEEREQMGDKMEVHPRLQGWFGDILAGDDSKLMQLLLHNLDRALPTLTRLYMDADPPSFRSAPGVNCSLTQRKRPLGAADSSVMSAAPVDRTERVIARSFLRPVAAPAQYGRRPAASRPELPSVTYVPRLHRAALRRAAAAEAGPRRRATQGFQCRPRLGRLGRLIIDRVPLRDCGGGARAQRGGNGGDAATPDRGNEAGAAAAAAEPGVASAAPAAPFAGGAVQIEPPSIPQSPRGLDGEEGEAEEVYALPPPRWAVPAVLPPHGAAHGAAVSATAAAAPSGGQDQGPAQAACRARVGPIVASATSGVVDDLRTRVRREELDRIMAMDDSEDEEVVLASRGHFVMSKDMEAIMGERTLEAAAAGTTAGVREHPLKFTMTL